MMPRKKRDKLKGWLSGFFPSKNQSRDEPGFVNDPHMMVVRGGQHKALIAEPFVERKIGAGGKPWDIFLDGLDELWGEDKQRHIIDLVNTFVHEHRDIPLLHVIASRPESHISEKFEDEEVRRSRWTKYIPIEDAERFLRSSFKVVQKKFRYSAHGLFAHAEVARRFIRGPDYDNTALRFEILSSVIDRSTAVPTKGNLFVHSDALYHEMLSSIPSALWPAAKLLLGFTIYEQEIYFGFQYYAQVLGTLRGMSILFSLSRDTIYASLINCLPALKIPDWKTAHKENLTFLHASFADYLKDSTRSANFHVGQVSDVERVLAQHLVALWKKCSGDDVPPASVESTWLQYCSEFDDEKPSSAKFHVNVFQDIVNCIAEFPRQIWNNRNPDLYEVPLLEVHMAKLCYCLLPEHLATFVQYEGGPLLSSNTNLCREARLGNLEFGHLDWKGMSPAKAYEGRIGKVFGEYWRLNRPRSTVELLAFVSELEDIQGRFPGIRVIIFGGVPSGRVAIILYWKENGTNICYAIPYPE